ncbi:MAG TPA: carboxypeptidase-like regulatory domain-containing protein [Flavobacterium sp.]|uniref:TonB-dependent receptor n=1 Tax=Flavobacterium sp. TaxID=239 RepID=UPI002C8FF468|nr:carboxypeptidase-like regulatory domain-containing protein [Flavobacterium sp.]HNP33420.1 carboxypeptidase-like regulatory domain-containing protein [Flavobacterium sp.]
MKTNKLLFTFLFLTLSIIAFAQNPTAKVAGIVLDEYNKPVENVNVSYQTKTVNTDANGFYSITIPANQNVVLVFTHTALKKVTATFNLKPNENHEFHPILSDKAEQLGEVVITNSRKRVQGITSVDPETIRKNPSAMPGVESVLKTFAGVNANNELSSGYNVRGGNYDENLVYVNEIEVYRPFLIRSGQQEGLSFTNTDMVQNVDFSAGGFQAKYGDKLSSVLDITYRKPTKFGMAAEASFLGGSLTGEGISKNKKWSAITGVRFRDNSLLVNSQETQTNYHPTYLDVQTNVNYKLNKKWEFSFLGNASQNKYNYQPLTRQTNFGTIDEPIALQVFYEGQEKDKYQTLFGALKTTFTANENNNFRLIGSVYHTQEQEYFDIFAAYYLGEVDTNIGSETLGQVTYNRGIGTQLNHARNDLDALIVNAEIKGTHQINNKKHQIDWGFKYTRENIRDRIVEWEVIDSAGFSINPPIVTLPHNEQPYNPYTGPLVPYQNVRATNFIDINRLSGYGQWSTKTTLGSSQLWINAGTRFHSWIVSGRGITGAKQQTVFSPRAQLSLKPDWEKDMLFRLAVGYYHQPPFYRELRDSLGTVRPNVKAQQSIHFVLSNDYNFKMNNRPFKLVTEAYYKTMTDVNTYTLENVRIRYRANNDAVAYAYGLDMRLNGEFVPGTESWLSFGYMKTEENQNDRGYIARPTDQRLKFGILFQDYMPNLPNMKLYLNLVYNTGLPGGSPSYADAYTYQSRLRDYRRADVGFSYVLTERNNERPEGHWLKKFQDLSIGFEIFNIFNNQNAITNTWVRDVYTKNQYGIPNYMTTRVFNLKLTAKL